MGANPPLTQVGLEQAQALAKLLEPIKIDQIFASDLTRAKQTARVIAKSKNLEVIEYKQIQERFFGSLDGQKDAEVFTKHQKQVEEFREKSLTDQMNWKIVEDMESLNEVIERILPFFNEVAKIDKNQTILAVTHANVIMSLLGHFGFINSFRELPYGCIQNTSYIKMEKAADAIRIIETFGINKIEAK